jgi:hypothetical protein
MAAYHALRESRHKQHLKRFLKKYPMADKNGELPIITVNPEDWAIDLDHPERIQSNAARCVVSKRT